MAIADVTKDTKFRDWRTITNEIKVVAESGGSGIGDVGDLDTTATDVVGAINEVHAEGDVNAADILAVDADVDALTLAHNTEVADIYIEIGDLATVPDTPVSVVEGLNNLHTEIGDTTILPGAPATVEAAFTNVYDDIGDVTTLDVDGTTDLTSAANTLKTVKLENTQVEYDNKELNHGRFMDETDLAPAVPTFNSGMLSLYNSSVITEGNKFINDNPTNGALAGNMITLAAALTTAGRTQTQYGYEFFIASIAQGAGVLDQITVNALNYNPIVENQNMYLGKIGSTVTWQGWVYNLDGAHFAILGNVNTTLYVNGALETAPYELDNSLGWVHVKQVITLTAEYENLFPALYCEDAQSSVVLVALSALFDGDVTPPSHLGLM